MGGLSSELLLGGNGIGDALSTTRRATDDAAALASALERLLNVSALQNVTCDAVQLLPNRTMQCAFVGMSPDCSHHTKLVDYLSLLFCTGSEATFVGMFVLLVIVLLYFVQLLVTTTRLFFVPPTEYLTQKLKFSPEVAGITLLALGTAIPDVMTAVSAGSVGDFNLVFSALVGASIFVGTGVLASVIFTSSDLVMDKTAFYRDCIACVVVAAAIVAMAVDGAIHLWESVIFVVMYILYIATVISVSYFARRRETKTLSEHLLVGTGDDEFSLGMDVLSGAKGEESFDLPQPCNHSDDDGADVGLSYRPLSAHRPSSASEDMEFIGPAGASPSQSSPLSLNSLLGESGAPMYKCGRGGTAARCCSCRFYHLAGLMFPQKIDTRLTTRNLKRTVGLKARRSTTKLAARCDSCWVKCILGCRRIIFIAEWPFSMLRWLSIPACDGKWDPVRRWAASFSPLMLSVVILLDCEGWNGFEYNGTIAVETVAASSFPLWSCFLSVASVLTIVLALATSQSDTYTLPGVYPLLVLIAFAGAVFWMDIFADEAVAIVASLGIGLNISTAVIGVTALAIGNSLAGLTANVSLAQKGRGKMAIASCFGAPLLSSTIGFGVALSVATSRSTDFVVFVEVHDQVKLAWVFLALALVGHTLHASGVFLTSTAFLVLSSAVFVIRLCLTPGIFADWVSNHEDDPHAHLWRIPRSNVLGVS
eukprot:INCI16271.14.p1 GENE.INCI16271.14~~INCI16271.14.p1  ORF type:complete len:706 (-),score=95.83 INCI16271.14:1474-3591(-)